MLGLRCSRSEAGDLRLEDLVEIVGFNEDDRWMCGQGIWRVEECSLKS